MGFKVRGRREACNYVFSVCKNVQIRPVQTDLDNNPYCFLFRYAHFVRLPRMSRVSSLVMVRVAAEVALFLQPLRLLDNLSVEEIDGAVGVRGIML